MGARHPGEIAQLVDIALPDVGVLTNIGEAHLEYFEDRAALARTKFAIFGRGARAVCNAADERTRMLAAEAGIDRAALWVRLQGDPQAPGLTIEAGLPKDGLVPVTFGKAHATCQLESRGRASFARCAARGRRSGAQRHGVRRRACRVGHACILPEGRFELHRASVGRDVRV